MTKANALGKDTSKKTGLSAKKEPLKDLAVKPGKDQGVKGGGTSGCSLTFKSTGRNTC